jgi:hypothetical protein
MISAILLRFLMVLDIPALWPGQKRRKGKELGGLYGEDLGL